MKLVLINSPSGEDYLSDLFLSAVLNSRKYDILTNHLSEYLFDSFQDSSKLYGNGFTAFCTVPNDLISKISLTIQPIENIFETIRKTPTVDYVVVYTSIWRYSHFIEQTVGNLKPNNIINIIVLDGEDHVRVHGCINYSVNYFKREMLTPHQNMSPISFCIPVSKARFLSYGVDYIPQKTALLAPCDPRFKHSYIFPTESSYYNQYAAALFATTTKKGGWDCLRHYEILLNHCVPLFPNICDKPNYTMSQYPIDLQVEANELFVKYIARSSCLDEYFWREYRSVLKRFLIFFYGNCLASKYLKLIESAQSSS